VPTTAEYPDTSFVIPARFVGWAEEFATPMIVEAKNEVGRPVKMADPFGADWPTRSGDKDFHVAQRIGGHRRRHEISRSNGIFQTPILRWRGPQAKLYINRKNRTLPAFDESL
jgi:hypothetical protein